MSSRRRRQKKGLVSDINVVPYIDVMLVLLVIFMVTAPMLTSGVTIELPEASTEPMNIETNEEPLIVSVRTNGELFINVGGEETSPVTLGVVKDRVMKVLAARPQTQVQLRGDTRLDYGTLMQVMSALQDAGVVSIGLVAEALNGSPWREFNSTIFACCRLTCANHWIVLHRHGARSEYGFPTPSASDPSDSPELRAIGSSSIAGEGKSCSRCRGGKKTGESRSGET